MVWDTVVDSIEGNEMVSGVKVTNKKAGEAGMITVDGVFIAVGIVPVSALIAGTVETSDHHGSRRRRELCDFGREISDQPLMASFE